MRVTSLVSLVLSAAVFTGCAVESPEISKQETGTRAAGATAVPDRDLTLQASAPPAAEVASPVELSRPIHQPKPAHRLSIARRPAPVPAPDPLPEVPPATEAAIPVPATAAQVLPEPAPVADAAVGVGRELAPGTTVTIIPAANGPSSAPEDPSWAPSGPGRSVIIEGGGGRGGTCRPRGGARGIGIAGRIPIGVPGRPLR